MIDWDYESRLIDRIDARALLAGLEPRRRRMVLASYVHGATYREIAEAEGISTGRTGQLVNKTMEVLRARARRLDPPVEAQARAPPPGRRALSLAPFGFDRVAFLEHMRRVIERRENVQRQLFLRERAELDRILADEEAAAANFAKGPVLTPLPIPVKLVPKAQPKLPPVPYYFGPPIPEPPQPTVQKLEPWFDLTKPLTNEYLQEIARYALRYFTAAHRPRHLGLLKVGVRSVRITCERTADAIAGALKCFADGLHGVLLSAVAEHVEGAVIAASIFVAVRLRSDGDRNVAIELTWDEA